MRLIRLRHKILLFLLWGLISFCNVYGAGPYTVNSAADAGAGTLRQAILDMNTAITGLTGGPGYIINFTGGPHTITLASPLPLLNEVPRNLTGGSGAAGGDLTVVDGITCTINGNGDTISGNNLYPIFFCNSGTFNINDLTLTNGRAKGGNGSFGNYAIPGGGGGGGFRGNSTLVWTLAGIGGGGLNGASGNTADNVWSGGTGGGGLNFNGGDNGGSGAGGGGGISGIGGNGSGNDGGAGGAGPPTGAGNGLDATVPAGGLGGAGNNGGGGGGGGGGATVGGSGGNGAYGGGGGGAGGYIAETVRVPGNGGFGGGGGGGGYAPFGNVVNGAHGGAFGGGGGPAGNPPGPGRDGGNGGFGGGGAGSGSTNPGNPDGIPGAGGFGGGNGSLTVWPNMSHGGGGLGAGAAVFVNRVANVTLNNINCTSNNALGGNSGGSTGGVQRGSALGGAVFVRQGGVLTVTSTATSNFTGNTLTAAPTGAVNSWDDLVGEDLYLMTGVTASFDGAGTITSNGTISGPGSITKTGTGIFQALGVNTYTGGTVINAGTFHINAITGLGDVSGPIAFAGGTLRLGASFALNRDMTLNAGGGTINTNSFDSTLSGNLLVGTGGSLTKIGTGTLILSGVNTYTGGTYIEEGVFQVSADNNLGGAGNITFGTTGASRTLRYGTAFTTTRNISLTGNGIIDTNGVNPTISGIISSGGTLTKISGGILTLSGNNTYNNGTTVSGGTLAVGNNNALGTNTASFATGTTLQFAGTHTIGNAISVTGNVTVDPQNPNTGTLSGVISGTGGITKINGGILVLSGGSPNTHTGAGATGGFSTTVSAGTVQLGKASGLGAGPASFATGTTLRFNTDLTVTNPLTINGTVNVNNSGNADSTLTALITGNAAATLNVTGPLILSGDSSAQFWNTSITNELRLTTGNNPMPITGDVTLNNPSTFNLNSLEQTVRQLTGVAGSSIDLGATGILTINNNGFTNTHAGTIINDGQVIKNGATGILILNGANAHTGANSIGFISTAVNQGILQIGHNTAMGDAGGGFGNASFANSTTLRFGANNLNAINNITLTGTVTVDTNTNDSQLSGIISGAGSLTKINAGVLTLPGNNTYSGGTTISAGAILLGNGSDIGPITRGPVGTGTLTFNDSGGNDSTLWFGGNFPIANPVALTTNGIVNTSNYTGTLLGVISGVAGRTLTKYDTGTLILSGDSSAQFWSTIINRGTLQLSTGSNRLPTTGDVTLNYTFPHDTIFNLNDYDQEIRVLTGQTGTTIDLMTTSDLTVNSGTHDGTITGGGQIIKLSGGVLVLNSANTHTGLSASGISTVINGGMLTVGHNTAMGTGSATFANSTTLRFGVDGLSLANALALTGTVTADTQAHTGTITGGISGVGAVLNKTSTGRLILTQANTYSGGTTVAAGILQAANPAALGAGTGSFANGTTLEYGAGINLPNNIALTGNVIADTNGNDGGLSGTITGTSAETLTKNGVGILNVSGDSSSQAFNTVINGGTLRLDVGPDRLPTSGNVTINGTSTFNLNGQNQTIGSLTGAAGTFVSLGAGILTTNSAAITTYGGVISGSGSFSKGGTGTLTLSGANTYTGATVINEGILSAGANNNLGDSTNPANILTFGTAGASRTLQYSAPFNMSRNILLNGNGTINTNGFDSTLSGEISGAGGLIKSGLGTLTLSNNNTYNGDTTVNQGTLIVTGAIGSITSDVSIAAGAILTGNGTITASPATVTVAGTVGALAVGDTLTLAGGADFTATGVLSAFVDEFGGRSLVHVTGNVNINALASIEVNALGAAIDYPSTQDYDLLTWDGVYTGTGFRSAVSNIGAPGIVFTRTIEAQRVYVSLRSFPGATFVRTQGSANTPPGPVEVIAHADVSPGYVFLQDDNGTCTFNLSGVAPAYLAKIGDGIVTLSGTNTYGGGTQIYSGGFAINNDSRLGNVNGGVVFDGGLLRYTATTTSPSTRTMTLDGGGGTIDVTGAFAATIDGQITVGTGGDLTKTGTGTLILNGNNTYAGGTTVSAGTLQTGHNNAFGTSSVSFATGTTLRYGVDGLNTANNVVLLGNATVDTQAHTGTLSGVVSNVGSLTKIGAGILILSNTNSYAGGTVIEEGILHVAADSNMGGGGDITFGTTGVSRTLRYGASFNCNRDVILTGQATINTNTHSSTLSGIISGAGRLIKTGLGTLTLSGVNTNNGHITIEEGVLNAIADASLGNAANIIRFGTSGASRTLQWGADFNTARDFDLVGNGTFDTNGFDGEITGVISNAGEFIKTGLGTLSLTNTHTYTGQTTVQAGVLMISGTIGPILFPPDITVDAGASLLGEGALATFNAGNVIIDGILGVTAPLDRITINGDLMLNTGDILCLVSAADGASLITVSGDANLNNRNLLVEIVGDPEAFENEQEYPVIQASTVTGQFATVVDLLNTDYEMSSYIQAGNEVRLEIKKLAIDPSLLSPISLSSDTNNIFSQFNFDSLLGQSFGQNNNIAVARYLQDAYDKGQFQLNNRTYLGALVRHLTRLSPQELMQALKAIGSVKNTDLRLITQKNHETWAKQRNFHVMNRLLGGYEMNNPFEGNETLDQSFQNSFYGLGDTKPTSNQNKSPICVLRRSIWKPNYKNINVWIDPFSQHFYKAPQDDFGSFRDHTQGVMMGIDRQFDLSDKNDRNLNLSVNDQSQAYLGTGFGVSNSRLAWGKSSNDAATDMRLRKFSPDQLGIGFAKSAFLGVYGGYIKNQTLQLKKLTGLSISKHLTWFMDGSMIGSLSKVNGENVVALGGNGMFDDIVNYNLLHRSLSMQGLFGVGSQIVKQGHLYCYGAVNYLKQGHDNYQEKGARGFIRNIEGQLDQTSQLGIGIMGSFGWNVAHDLKMGIQFKSGISRNYAGQSKPYLTVRLNDLPSSFTSSNVLNERFQVSQSIGLSLSLSPGVDAYMVYQLTATQHSKKHDLSCRLTARF